MKQEILAWFLDLISPWLVPRADYDLRLERINAIDRENRAMLEVHRDYVSAQLRAPDLTRVLLDPMQSELRYYIQPEAWPPLWNKPNVLDIELQQVREERSRLQRFRAEMTVDEKVLEHYNKYSGGLFRTIAQKLLVEMCMKLMRSS